VLMIIFVIPVFSQFQVVETEHASIIYTNPMHEFLIPHVVRCHENALTYHCHFWDYKPSERIVVTLLDIGDYGNAGATAIPVNRVAVMMAPTGFAYETAPANERINTMMNHELVHVMALDKASGQDNFFRTVFMGKIKETSENPVSILYAYLTNPRASAPRWFHEGIAVFMETWMAGGIGRAQGAYDEMVFRTMVRDGGHFYDPVGLESEAMKTDFQVGVMAYLYGTRFFNYLVYLHGPDKLLKWVNRSDDSKGYFSSQFKKVYGQSLNDGWSKWIEWEEDFQGNNLEAIRGYPPTGYRAITAEALGSLSRGCYDASRGKIYLGINNPGQVAHLAAIDIKSGRCDKICDIDGPALYYVTSLAYDSVSGTLFFTSDNNDWRDLKAVDVATGKSKMLQKDARIGDLVYNYSDSSLWGIKHFNGISTVVRVPYPYDKWRQVHSWPYGTMMYDIDISPGGQMLTGALAHISGQQEMIMMSIPSLLKGDSTYRTLFSLGTGNPANFVFSGDGRYLYGSSYLTGVSNIFRYDIEADSLEGMSNCETGFFRPLPISADSIMVLRYTGQGFMPVMIKDSVIEDINPIRFLGMEAAQKFPEIRDWMIGSPMEVNLDSVTIKSGHYSPFSGLELVAGYPIVEGYKDYPAYGMRFEFSEPIGMYHSDVTASYTPNRSLPEDQRFHGAWNFNYMQWSLNARYNGADFYDLFGPTKSSRKGYSLGLGYEKYLIYDGPRQMTYNLRLTGYGDLERLPDYQNVTATYDRFMTFDTRLSFKNRTASLGAVDYEKGYMWQLAYRGSYVVRNLHNLVSGTFDLGIPLPLNHSSLWFRNAAGFSTGDRGDPFDNFYFGGFGNNRVDYKTPKQYRLYYSFPGMELNEIGGINFAKVMTEWSLPPLRFRRLGTTSFYLTWAHLTFFGMGISTNIDQPEWQRKVGGLGTQLDFRLTLLSHLRLTLSAGYAMAFENDYKPVDEFMFSIRIL